MKRMIMIALALVVSASFYTAYAGQKDKKKKKGNAETVMETIRLTTPSDSVSYAAGAAMTEGLLPFLQQQYGVDEAFLDDFLRGFEEALKCDVDEPMKAYGAGIQIAKMVKERMLPSVSTDFQGTNDSIQGKLFQKGFIAALRKDTTFFKGEEARNYFRNRQEAVILAAQEATRKAGEQFLNENKQKEGVKTTASGLQYKVLVAGNGPVPTQDDRVIVKYEGRLIDGTVFDSSYEREEQTNKFRPTEVIKGWTEALTMMPVGSKWELYIPQELAYGSRKTGSIPAYSALVFIVELVGIDQP